MQILLKCCTPEFVDDPTHAVVDFTPALARSLWDRIQLAKKLKAEDAEFIGLRYDDWSPEWFDFGPGELEQITEMLSTFDEEFTEEDFDSDMDGGLLILPRKLERLAETSMRPVSLHVGETRFYWIAYHKHGGMESRVETTSCTEKDLQEWAKEHLGMELTP